jgi:DNA-binding LacI/PurR family transcriptional regulator
LQAALDRRLPTVIVDQPRVEGVSFVGINDEVAARAIADHILDLGHETLGVVSFSLSPGGHTGLADVSRQRAATYPVSRLRLRGYAAAAEARGIRWSGVPVYECSGSGKELGSEAAEALLSASPRPTALICLSDELALGAIEAVRGRGLSVPAHVSVVGFDNIPAGAYATPTLTTVDQDHFGKGLAAARLLTDQINGTVTPSTLILESPVVRRASTGRPSSLK